MEDNTTETTGILEKTSVRVVLAIIIVVISICIRCALIRNDLVDIQEEVNLAQSNVETMMQRRLELIPDLVSTVREYTEHEKQVYQDIAKAREALKTSLDNANEDLSVAVNSLLAIAESYPELTSKEQYISLMDQLEGSVNRISIAREEYNEKVADYNKTIRHFPENIVAKIFGFDEIDGFKADESAKNPNIVDFEN